MNNTYTYKIGNKIYINLTNRCSNCCDFCIRNTDDFHALDLWLRKEPTAKEVIASFEDLETSDEEVVFCGYGEPTYKLPEIIEIAEYLHSKNKKVRLNTNGQGELITGGNVAKQLSGAVDSISISLNAVTKEKYNDLCHPLYGEEAFEAILKFTRECKKYIPEVTLSVVDVISLEDQKIAQKIADELGVNLRIRKYEK
ncbi:MAG TPA: TatD family nuclease-associated radical SAM protein [Clostridia bacterium]|jgi:TatD family-associated radical SAM protein|nr:TatD family nuclease-associated radical SAM protein [Clostridia bacterium]